MFRNSQVHRPRCFSLIAALLLASASFSALAQSGPRTTPEVVAAALAGDKTPIPDGPFKPTWESMRENYKVPEWLRDAKYGIFVHFGLYSVANMHNEWYEKYIYSRNGISTSHIHIWGPLDKFGYKDFIPLFTIPKFDAAEWAKLFKDGGAKYFIPTAQHHDGWANWDSQVTPFNSMAMGPHKDIIGELAKATRAEGLKFGVANHEIESFSFVAQGGFQNQPGNDLHDPKWAAFYHTDDQSPKGCEAFLTDWLHRHEELVDKYQPDLVYFDNGANGRIFDPLKLKAAAYYYNRAAAWGKEVSIATKGGSRSAAQYVPAKAGDDPEQATDCYPFGALRDFEGLGNAPKTAVAYPWEAEDKIIGGRSSWCYTDREAAGPPDYFTTVPMNYQSAARVIANIVRAASCNGNYVLNLSPMGDGSIPEGQQKIVREAGSWLKANGEAIYGTRPWHEASDGGYAFTTSGPTLYAINTKWPGEKAVIPAMASGAPGAFAAGSVTLLGHDGELKFEQTADNLTVSMPDVTKDALGYALKIVPKEGAKANPVGAGTGGTRADK